MPITTRYASTPSTCVIIVPSILKSECTSSIICHNNAPLLHHFPKTLPTKSLFPLNAPLVSITWVACSLFGGAPSSLAPFNMRIVSHARSTSAHDVVDFNQAQTPESWCQLQIYIPLAPSPQSFINNFTAMVLVGTTLKHFPSHKQVIVITCVLPACFVALLKSTSKQINNTEVDEGKKGMWNSVLSFRVFNHWTTWLESSDWRKVDLYISFFIPVFVTIWV